MIRNASIHVGFRLPPAFRSTSSDIKSTKRSGQGWQGHDTRNETKCSLSESAHLCPSVMEGSCIDGTPQLKVVTPKPSCSPAANLYVTQDELQLIAQPGAMTTRKKSRPRQKREDQ